MKHSKHVVFFFFILVFVKQAQAQPLPNYYTRTQFLFTPASVFEDGLLGFANPANLAVLAKPEFRFAWSSDGSEVVSLRNWGVFTGISHLGFSVQRQKFNGIGVTDFKLSTAAGSQALSFGLSYGWSAGKNDASGREKLFSVGTILRPSKYFSFGVTGNFSLESQNREGVAALGVRPLGTPKLTLFGDAALQKGTDLEDIPWSAGAAFQLLPGLTATGRYFKNNTFTMGLSFNFGRRGLSSQSHFDSDANHRLQSYIIRSGGNKPSFMTGHFQRAKYYTAMTMKGRVDYLKYRLLDSGRKSFFQILKNIKAAESDPRIQAVALNLSAMHIIPEQAWEIREALKSVQKAGKKVLIFIDTPRMTGYHLASVADKIVLDPQGSILLRGYVLSKTYFKGTLDKLGLGFDEWRLFKYKSAAEVLSRTDMSDADREQLQDYIDDWYDLTRQDVCASRNFPVKKFDQLIDEQTYFDARQALKSGLVDTLARWSEVDGLIAELTKTKKKRVRPEQLLSNSLPQQNWGIQPKIAVVYGLGVCAMDEGIKARWLKKVFLALAKNRFVKAVVFRVDSPGGDGMASDVVAEAVRTCRKNKPVIISQGQVAASGGYWLSMYGDAILAAPNTITGSIGVIFGWLYDKSFGEKLGLTSDLVQKGKHADLGSGIRLPFLNLQVPARNLNDEERKKASELILNAYEDFVLKVAEGRKLPVARVKEIAQGHVYSGKEGKRLKLVDKLGGMLEAIELAKAKAGLTGKEDVQIIEVPANKGLLNLQSKLSPFGFSVKNDPTLRFIRFLTTQNGKATSILLPGMYPDTTN